MKIEIIGKQTPEVKSMLAGALKWLRRIEDRGNELPKRLFDNGESDPAPLRMKIQRYLEECS